MNLLSMEENIQRQLTQLPSSKLGAKQFAGYPAAGITDGTGAADRLARVTITAPGFSAAWEMPREKVADILKFAAECIIESHDAVHGATQCKITAAQALEAIKGVVPAKKEATP